LLQAARLAKPKRKPAVAKLTPFEQRQRQLIEQGVSQLITCPQYKAFQIVMTGVCTYSVIMCEDRPPKAKYGKLQLGYKGSCGYDLYYIVEWDEAGPMEGTLLVFSEFWEEGEEDEGGPFYYSEHAREDLIREAKRLKKTGKKSDNWPAKPMVRKGGPFLVASMPKANANAMIELRKLRLQAELALLS